MKQGVLGGISVIAIIISIIYLGISINNNPPFGLKSQVIDSRAKADEKSVAISNPQKLFTVVQSINSEIETALWGAATPGVVESAERSSLVKKTSVAEFETTDEKTLRNLVTQRENFLKELAKTNPELFLAAQLSKATVEKLKSLGFSLEKDVRISGKINTAHFHDDRTEGYFEYYLNTGKETLRVYPTREMPLLSGTRIEIEGVRLGDIIVARPEGVEITSPAPAPSGPNSPFGPRNPVEQHNMLVLLVNFQDSGAPYITPADMHTRIFSGPFQSFFTEQSYGKINFTGNVLGWFTLPRNFNNVKPEWPNGTNELSNLLASNSIDISGYDHVVFMIDQMSGGFGTLGRFSIDGQELPVPMVRLGLGVSILGTGPVPAGTLRAFDRNLAHEIGHNLGLLHANFLDCGNQILRTDCTHVESGNLYDTMGLGTYSYHFSAYYKELLGWITPQETLTITQNGRYTINPLASSGTNLKKFAKIVRPSTNTTPYYVELRKAIGYDTKINAANTTANQNGLIVNRIVSDSNSGWSSLKSPELLDMQPISSGPPDSAAVSLNIGSQFTDSDTGITIGPVISSSASSITFDVANGVVPCTRNAPIVTLNPLIQYSVAGRSGTMQIAFGNADTSSCGSSAFGVTASMPSVSADVVSFTDVQTDTPNQPIDITVPVTITSPAANHTLLYKSQSISWPYSISPSQDVTIVPIGSILPTHGKNLTYTVPPGTKNGVYPITVTVTNKSTGMKTTKTMNINVVSAPFISSVAPISGPVGTNVTITGSGFGVNPRIFISNNGSYGEIIGASNSNTLNFAMPSTLFQVGCTPTCNTPVVPGVYNIVIIQNNGIIFSNQKTFTVTN